MQHRVQRTIPNQDLLTIGMGIEKSVFFLLSSVIVTAYYMFGYRTTNIVAAELNEFKRTLMLKPNSVEYLCEYLGDLDKPKLKPSLI